MSMLLALLAAVAVADTLIGNALFPGKTGVVRVIGKREYWAVYKMTRFLFVPVRCWCAVGAGVSVLEDSIAYGFNLHFEGSQHHISEADAITTAKYYNTPIFRRWKKDVRYEEVWTSSKRAVKTDDAHKLLLEMLEAESTGDSVLALQKLKELQTIHKL